MMLYKAEHKELRKGHNSNSIETAWKTISSVSNWCSFSISYPSSLWCLFRTQSLHSISFCVYVCARQCQRCISNTDKTYKIAFVRSSGSSRSFWCLSVYSCDNITSPTGGNESLTALTKWSAAWYVQWASKDPHDTHILKGRGAKLADALCEWSDFKKLPAYADGSVKVKRAGCKWMSRSTWQTPETDSSLAFYGRCDFWPRRSRFLR